MNEQERAAWLAARRKGISGTDIAAIAGLHPYKDALGVWLEKTGRHEEVVENKAVEWGMRHEPTIAQKCSEVLGLDLEDPGLQKHPEHDWVIGTPDRLTVFEDKPLGIEIKTSRFGDGFGEDGSQIIPGHYLVQLSWYMLVTDIDRWMLVVLIGGSDDRYYWFDRDKKIEQHLFRLGRDFWNNNILEDVPPEPNASSAYAKAIGNMYPQDDGDEIVGDEVCDRHAGSIIEINAEIKGLQAKKTAHANEIKTIMGPATRLVGDGYRALWKTNKRGVRPFKLEAK